MAFISKARLCIKIQSKYVLESLVCWFVCYDLPAILHNETTLYHNVLYLSFLICSLVPSTENKGLCVVKWRNYPIPSHFYPHEARAIFC